MYPVKIEFENVGPYRGAHSVDLVSDVYAIVAEHETNPERSNWIGKSTFLWLVPYALFGLHTSKTDDGWITHHQNQATVVLTMDDGSIVKRYKKQGGSTQIRFTPAGGKELTQKAAQEAIDRYIGLSKDDFMATCFYEQKQLSRMVSARSAERIAIVEAWLSEDLEPLQNMHASAMLDLAALNKTIAKNEAEIARTRPDPERRKALKEAVDEAMGKHAESDVALLKAEQARNDAELWAAKLEIADEFDQIAAEGEQAKKELESIADDVEEQLSDRRDELADAIEEHTRKNERYSQLGQSCRGAFDGNCPVNGHQCPMPDWVRGKGADPDEVLKAKAERDKASTARATLESDVYDLEGQVQQKSSLSARLSVLRTQAEGLLETANEVAEGNPPDIKSLDLEVAHAKQQMSQDKAAVISAEAELQRYDQDVVTHQEAVNESAQLAEERALLSEACRLLGKGGAQQKLGEIALAHVEAGANAILSQAGIDLSVTVRWVVHLSGLAKHCHECGTAFPTSARVKECPNCGAKRGKNQTAKLVIELSNQSGAAEDLAGMAVGLAASQWLRAKRTSQWGAVYIDEPFGALDTYNRKALSVHVSTMLQRAFQSAFIVAHDRTILDALPNRVRIVGRSSGGSFLCQ